MITRLIALSDAATIANLMTANWDFFTPYEPYRAESYFTAEGQHDVIADLLAKYNEGAVLPHVVLDGDRVVGRITITNIVRGPLLSGNLGYWINQSDNGRGLASAAVAELIRTAFDELGLHRLEAGTLVHNVRSQKVLQRNGFERFGLAPRFLKINGDWQDHILYQRLNE